MNKLDFEKGDEYNKCPKRRTPFTVQQTISSEMMCIQL